MLFRLTWATTVIVGALLIEWLFWGFEGAEKWKFFIGYSFGVIWSSLFMPRTPPNHARTPRHDRTERTLS